MKTSLWKSPLKTRMAILLTFIAALSPILTWAVHPLPQPAQTNPPIVVGASNQIVWHDLRTTNRVWLVKPKKGKEAEALSKLVGKKTKHLKRVGLIRVESSEHPGKLLTGLVEYVSPDRQVQIQEVIPNDPLWSNQWDRTKIKMDAAWAITTGSSNVIVAVIDTGVDYTHPDLQANLWTGPSGEHGYQCSGGVVSVGGADVNGHGTHCAGTIGAVGNNSLGIAGVNWSVKIIAMRFLDSGGGGQDSDAAALIDKLIELKQGGQNIRVASCSWGGFGEDQVLSDAFQALENAGILSCCASGNSGLNIDLYPFSPGGMTNRGIICVNASDSSDVCASFSDYGLVRTDIAAPGVSTWSTLSTGPLPLRSDTGYGPLSGTSMATPQVAGVAALLCAVRPNLSVYQVKDTLLNRNSYDSLDFGKGQFSTTSGRLNAYRALTNSSAPANHAPVVTPGPATNIVGGQPGQIAFTATDADGDALRYAIIDPTGRIPFQANNTATFTAPHYAIPAPFSVIEEASDRNGGGAMATATGNILVDPSWTTDYFTLHLVTNYLRVDTNIGVLYLGMNYNYGTNSNPAVAAQRTTYFCGQYLIGVWRGGDGALVGNGFQDVTGVSTNSSWRIFFSAQNDELTIQESQKELLRLGNSATNTHPYPNLICRFDKTVGTAPLTVNYRFSDRDGNNGPYEFDEIEDNGDRTDLGSSGTITFDSPGIYTRLFAVLDAQGWSDVKAVLFSALGPTTNAPPPPPPVPPVADFSGSPTRGQAPLFVQFSNLSSNATSYAWAFGDGGTSVTANPSESYSSAGSYTVSLTATGPGGTNTMTRVGYITVTNAAPPPPPPSPVTNLVMVTNLLATDAGFQANLRWTDLSTGEDRYLVESSRKSHGSWSVISTTAIPANSSSYVFTPSQGGFFRFRVRAAAGLTFAPWSGYSAQVKL